MEISNNKETNQAAWAFYAQEQDLNGKLNDAIKQAGTPDSDQNSEGPIQISG